MKGNTMIPDLGCNENHPNKIMVTFCGASTIGLVEFELKGFHSSSLA